MPNCPRVCVKKGADKRINAGHLWIFSNELEEIIDEPPGTAVEVIDSKNRSRGIGFYNPNSLIAVRLLKTDEPPSVEFFERRISRALKLREKTARETEMFRLVYGESDYLPGLIIDKYGDYFALQTLSFGMDARLGLIIDSLRSLFPYLKGIVAKNFSSLRKNEGLELFEEVVYGEVEPCELSENGILYSIDILGGQKTGFFLDQRDNRAFVRKVAEGLKTLDCFCNQGGFGFNALKGGASMVLGIDASDYAVEKALASASLNGFDNYDAKVADVFEFLKNEKGKWDAVITDPPAFAKSAKKAKSALAGYRKLNRLAMRALKKEGFLFASSCSLHISEEDFLRAIASEAAKTGIGLKEIYRGGQASDHPVLPAMRETRYLKFYAFRVEK